MSKTSMLELDGALGEGGGQVLRTALTLSAITGTPFRIHNIRAGRARPGLLRQHLTAVEALAAICSAEVSGASTGSQQLSFQPGRLRGGDYRFAIGTAGSCTLVLQTVLPALWFAAEAATLVVSGGTHNPAAPPADFLIRAWAPLLARMGVRQQVELLRHGFYPAGGGELRVAVQPCGGGLRPLHLQARGARLSLRAEARVAGVPVGVANREIERLRAQLADMDGAIRELPAREGPGNVLLVEVAHEEVVELFTAFGARGVSAETVADGVGREVRHYLESGAAVGEHLADQLLLPMALAGGGGFTTTMLSSHLRTNAVVIERFLPVRILMEAGAVAAGVQVVPKPQEGAPVAEPEVPVC